MNSFHQHIPAFVDCDRPAAIPFETTADLLALEVVQRYKGPTHSHFAISDSHLMEISNDGFSWWVVGFIAQPESVDLPKWDGGKHLARLSDGREVILPDSAGLHVGSSCGGQLRLSDGSVAVDVRYERQMAKQAADRKKEADGICAGCDVKFTRTEADEDGQRVRVEQRCPECGRGIISWRAKVH